MKRRSMALFLFTVLFLFMTIFLFSLLPAYGSPSKSTAYCTPNFSVAPLPNTQSGNLNSTGEVCFVVQNAGPLAFNCSNMQGRTVTVNGTPYAASSCDGSTGKSVTISNTNDGQYYFDVSAGGVSYASIAFWAGSGSGEPSDSGGADGTCTATLAAGQKWSDRYNLNVRVTGPNNWKVTMTYPNQEKMIATWNINARWPQSNVLVAKPNGNGNNWGVTIKPNGNWTWPTVKCEIDRSTPPSTLEPVHVQVRSMSISWPDEHPTTSVGVDAGYALTGGGGYAQYSGAGAFLTASKPEYDGWSWYWEASSQDVVETDSHMLTAYAVGLHLDGVNGKTLQNLMSLTSMAFPPVPGGSSNPAGALGIGTMTLGGGAYTETSGAGQLLTRTVADGSVWQVASKDHLVSSPGWIDAVTLTLNTTGIIERFGALEARQMKAETTTVASGVGTSIGYVTPGWSLASLGGEATTTSGPGRMLFRIGTDESARTVIVQSKDHLGASAGQTTASWNEVRRVPTSHGTCSQGPALASTMDACVANVCAADPHCCQTWWDGACVAKVTSICGRSCADDSCSIPTYNPDYWNDGGTAQDNNYCYNYAANKRTDTKAQPGRAAGVMCGSPHSGCSAEEAARLATADGFIPTTLQVGCADNRALVALFGREEGDFHWYRQDRDGTWSHKRGYDVAKNTDASGHLITDIENFDRGDYPILVGYFCVCSSSSEGQGHENIE
jgi:hypothetical protein